jgi:hypothetical protein
MRNIGHKLGGVPLDGLLNIIGGSGNDNVEQDGDILATPTYISEPEVPAVAATVSQTQQDVQSNRFHSGVMIACFEASGADAETFNVTMKLTTSADSGMAGEVTLAELADAVVFTAATGALRQSHVLLLPVDLTNILDFFRGSITVNISAVGLFDVVPFLLLGGSEQEDAPAPLARTEAT